LNVKQSHLVFATSAAAFAVAVALLLGGLGAQPGGTTPPRASPSDAGVPAGGMQPSATANPSNPDPDIGGQQGLAVPAPQPGGLGPAGATIVVLGHGVYENGSVYDIARLRVEKAVELYKAGRGGRILFSGGWACSLAEKPPVTEAEAMGRYAASLGVDPDAILIENLSRNTIGNAYQSRRYFEAHGLPKEVILVTSDFHMERGRYLIDKFFGPGYSISAESADSGLSAADRQARRLSEQNSLNAAKASLGKITDGDYAALDALIRRDLRLICS
jgi:uncharacterized SAM-binding protein YcdF (DUF218 family)